MTHLELHVEALDHAAAAVQYKDGYSLYEATHQGLLGDEGAQSQHEQCICGGSEIELLVCQAGEDRPSRSLVTSRYANCQLKQDKQDSDSAWQQGQGVWEGRVTRILCTTLWM